MSPYLVADYLAQLNNEVHEGVKDKSVGPRCVVAWRRITVYIALRQDEYYQIRVGLPLADVYVGNSGGQGGD